MVKRKKHYEDGTLLTWTNHGLCVVAYTKAYWEALDKDEAYGVVDNPSVPVIMQETGEIAWPYLHFISEVEEE